MTEPEGNQPASPVRGIGSIIAALILIVVGLLFLLATACFGYLGITLSSDKSYRDLAPFLLIGSGVCALIFYGVVRGLIKMLKKR